MILLTKATWALINDINRQVNFQLIPEPDPIGKDSWDVKPPGSTADCDDYAVTKRARLIEAGLPWQDLRLATCMTFWSRHFKKPMGNHMVLLVDSIGGAYVMDSPPNDEVLPWRETGYFFKWIQSADENGKIGWRQALGQDVSRLPYYG